MSQDPSRTPDPVRSALRAAVAAVERVLPQPSATAGEPAAAGSLEGAWRDLVALLSLGPEPEYRECPSCHALAMREATVCGHCWTKLAPLKAVEGAH